MGIRIHKQLGYGLVDLEIVENGSLDDDLFRYRFFINRRLSRTFDGGFSVSHRGRDSIDQDLDYRENLITLTIQKTFQ